MKWRARRKETFVKTKALMGRTRYRRIRRFGRGTSTYNRKVWRVLVSVSE